MQNVQRALAQLNKPKMNKELLLSFADLSVDETNAILQGLQELPAKICNPLTEKLRAQAGPQIQAFQQELQRQAEQQQEQNPDALVLDGNMNPVNS